MFTLISEEHSLSVTTTRIFLITIHHNHLYDVKIKIQIVVNTLWYLEDTSHFDLYVTYVDIYLQNVNYYQ